MTVLVPVNEESYRDYIEAAIAGYAQDNVRSGRWPEPGSLERSRADFDALLPLGPATPDHHVFEVHASDPGALVGFAWLAIERKPGSTTGFIYDLEIKPEHRRRGHASRALSALETFAADEGATSMGLHVFAFNSGARALYSSCGYEVVSINMRKAL